MELDPMDTNNWDLTQVVSKTLSSTEDPNRVRLVLYFSGMDPPIIGGLTEHSHFTYMGVHVTHQISPQTKSLNGDYCDQETTKFGDVG